MSDAEDAAMWHQIEEAWITYCKHGAGKFDWDYESRDLMESLTGEAPFQWVT